MPNPFDQFDSTPAASGANPFDQFDPGPSLRVTVRPYGGAKASAAENLAAPIANIPSTYSATVRSGLESMGGGLEQAGAGAQALAGQALAPERPSLGPIPISTRLKAVGDILGGLGRAGAGAVEYTGAPVMAPIESMLSQPLENVTGLPKELTNFAAGLALPIPKRIPLPTRTAKPLAQPTEGLFDVSQGLYQEAAQSPKMFEPGFTKSLKNETLIDLSDRGFRPYTDQKTFQALDELPIDRTAQIKDFDAVRKTLVRIAKSPADRDAAQAAIGKIDEALGGQVPEIEQARGFHAAGRRSERFQEAIDRAERSKAPFNEAIKSEFRSILNSREKRRGYSQAELGMMDQIAKGAFAGNALEAIAGMAGGKGGLIGTVTGAVSKGVLPAVGYGLNKLSGVMTQAQVAKLDELLRSRTPAAARIGLPLQDYSNVAQAFEVAPTARNLARLTLASRNLSTNLADIGIELAPDRLIGMQRPVPAGDQQEQP